MLTCDKPALAYVSWGTWVAECPQPWCLGADHYGPGPNTGRIGGLGERDFCCPRCGTVAPAQWPDNADDIEAVLAARPMPEHRNWNPGESLQQLLLENAAHGITTGLRKNAAITIADDSRFTDRTLLAGRTLLAIGGR